MRKYLLSTSAIAGISLLSTAALAADISITGTSEFEYQNSESNVEAQDGTTMGTTHEVLIGFTEKTDDGLTLEYLTQFDADTAGVDDNVLTIEGGFGKLFLGNTDGAEDMFAVTPDALIAEESDGVLHASATIRVDTGSQITGNATKITYTLPPMGGLTAGISLGDSGLAANSETTEYGVNYSADTTAGSLTLGYSHATQENGALLNNSTLAPDTENSVLGASLTNGPLSVSVGQINYTATGEDVTGDSIAVRYALPNGITVAAMTYQSEDDIDVGEEYSANQYEAIYSITAGLNAVVTIADFDYKIGTSGNNGAADNRDGTITTLNIRASF